MQEIGSSLSSSLNLEELLGEDETSSVVSFIEQMSEATRNRLRDILSLLEKDIAKLVEDADPVRQFLSKAKNTISPTLLEALMAVSEIEDQAPMVRKAQRRLTQHQTLLTQSTLGKQELKELVKSSQDLESISSKVQPNLDRLKSKRTEFGKELAKVTTAI